MSSASPHATANFLTGYLGLRDYSEMIVPVVTRKPQEEGGHIFHDK